MNKEQIEQARKELDKTYSMLEDRIGSEMIKVVYGLVKLELQLEAECNK